MRVLLQMVRQTLLLFMALLPINLGLATLTRQTSSLRLATALLIIDAVIVGLLINAQRRQRLLTTREQTIELLRERLESHDRQLRQIVDIQGTHGCTITSLVEQGSAWRQQLVQAEDHIRRIESLRRDGVALTAARRN